MPSPGRTASAGLRRAGPATRKSADRIPLGENAGALDRSPAGKRIAVTSEVASMVDVVDATSDQVLSNRLSCQAE